MQVLLDDCVKYSKGLVKERLNEMRLANGGKDCDARTGRPQFGGVSDTDPFLLFKKFATRVAGPVRGAQVFSTTSKLSKCLGGLS
jgi:hypothetical protein